MNLINIISIGILLVIFIYLIYNYINDSNVSSNEASSKNNFNINPLIEKYKGNQEIESNDESIIYKGKIYYKNAEGKYILNDQ